MPLRAIVTSTLVACLVPHAPGAAWDEACGEWSSGFGVPGTADVGATVIGGSYVTDLVVFDDGAGSALYVAGEISVAGATQAMNVARWDGAAWTALGAGLDRRVTSLVSFDDGSGGGARLIAGGVFAASGQDAVHGVAAWDGSRWTALGVDIAGLSVNDLVVFDEGSGPALYAAASVWLGGALQNVVLRWDGSGWSRVGGAMNAAILALEVFDEGSGPRLFAGGRFDTVGGLAVEGLTRWDGTQWSGVAGGVGGSLARVEALFALDDGSGPALFVGGRFDTAGATVAPNVARWDGQAWAALGAGLSGGAPTEVRAFAAFDEGSGPRLLAAGHFFLGGGEDHVARWDGASWSPVGGGVEESSATVHALTVFDDGSGAALFAGGDFAVAGGGVAHDIARWNGSAWSAVAAPGHGGLGGPVDAYVSALAVLADATARPTLFAGGSFTTAGEERVHQIAQWDGTTWSTVGEGVGGGTIAALIGFDDGGGKALYAGGSFTEAGGLPADHIARWNAGAWLPLPGFSGGPVNTVAVHDEGGGAGPALHAAGFGVGRWDGTSWSGVGTGFFDLVLALASYDDGSGPALYAGGLATGGIARWDGTRWAPVGGGFGMTGGPPVVRGLVVHDDGSGPALYAAGAFDTASGSPARHLARWDGSSWSSVGGGLDAPATSLAVYRGELVVGGLFQIAGTTAAARIASWDGEGWSALDGGLDDSPLSFAVFDDGAAPPSLFVGGRFVSAGISASARVAEWTSGCECPAIVRCTAKVNSLGCTPSIEATGFASLTDPTPFEIRALDVLNRRRGGLVFGLSGPAETPWFGGTLCLRPPLVRGPFLNSGGSAASLDCSGQFRFDFNAWIQSGAQLGWLAGTRIDAQLWYHDSGALGGIGSTNAIAFWICP